MDASNRLEVGDRGLIPTALVASLVFVASCSTPVDPDGPPSPSVQSPESPVEYAVPPVRGLVRETNGGSIAGVTVRYSSKGGLAGPQSVSDEAGVFVLPRWPEPCSPRQVFGFVVVKSGYFQGRSPTVACSPNPQEVSVEIKLQRSITVEVGSSVETILSNDDLDFEGLCEPCKGFILTPRLRGPAMLRVDWSGSAQLSVWLTGWDQWYSELLAEIVPAAGESRVTQIMPSEWGGFDLEMNVGLPRGSRSRGGLSGPLTVRIELRSLP